MQVLSIVFFIMRILGQYLDMQEPGSSVSIVSGYELDCQAIQVRFPAEKKDFFL
jgi:hypothetical protein